MLARLNQLPPLDPQVRLTVLFTNETKVSVKTVRELHLRMTGDRKQSAMVFSRSGCTPGTRKEIESQARTKKIEIISYTRMQYRLIQGERISFHRIVPGCDVPIFLQRLSLQKKELPKMLPDDPLAVYYGLEIGDAIIHWRMNESTECVTYMRILARSLTS